MDELKLLGPDDIKAADDLQDDVVDVPEWGGAIRLRELTADERGTFLQAASKNGKKEDVRQSHELLTRAVLLSAVNGEGNRLFKDEQLPDLAGKSARVIQRLGLRALELSGLTEQAMEEALGNSEAGSDGSSSA